MRENLIKGIEDPVLQYFDGIEPADGKATEISIQDLLTMRSGFQWGPDDESIYQSQKDWTGFLFSKPLSDVPGSRFYYNSMNSVLLADIIDRQTGGDSVAFLTEKLFGPIGIRSWCWLKTQSQSLSGGTGLAMTTEDLARFGYLYLHGDRWDGKQVVPEEWVRDSVRIQTNTAGTQHWQTEYYGYQWWIIDENAFAAIGGKSQYCYVNRKSNLVVAINSSTETAKQDKAILDFLRNVIPQATAAKTRFRKIRILSKP
ncbi:MAG: serine hydrolase [Spirochaetales bacterium]|nr:serine hydrolase [Spirochaetales bacterium]